MLRFQWLVSLFRPRLGFQLLLTCSMDGTHEMQFALTRVAELLNAETFACLKEAQVLVEAYRRQYNHHRPHSSLGYQTPAAFAAACLAATPASAGPAPPPHRTETVDNPLLTTGT